MRLFKTANILLAFALAGTMTACASKQRDNADVENRPEDIAAVLPRPVRTQPATRPAEPSAPAPAPAPRGDCTWPTRSGGGMKWVNMAYPTGSAKTSAIGLEKGVPLEVRAKTEFIYELVVSNLTQNAHRNVVVVDQPGEYMNIVSSNPQGRRDGALHSWIIGDLAPCETKTIKIRATASRDGQVTSCASVSYDTMLCASIPVVAPQLALTKTGPAEVLKCDPIEYKFVVTNPGTGTVRGVKIVDQLPNGLVSANGGSTITISAGDLTAGQSREFTATAKATRAGAFMNKATASGGGDERAVGDVDVADVLTASSGTVNTVVRAPMLAITKTGPQRSFIGRTITYEIKVNNNGDGVARDTVITDAVPSGCEFVSASNGGALQGGTVRWNVGNLQPKGMASVTMTVRSGQAGVVRNTATASAYCADDVSASHETSYQGIPAMLLEVIDLEDPDEVGTTMVYVITATNQGSAVAKNVTIVCTLEDSVAYDSSSGATIGTVTGNVIRFQPLPTLAPQAKGEWRVVVRGVRAADSRFRVSMTEDQLTRPVEETESTNFYE